jgi:hypothetical protein
VLSFREVSVFPSHIIILRKVEKDSEAWYTINDSVPVDGIWDSIAGLYQTKGNEWVRIHTNFPQ